MAELPMFKGVPELSELAGALDPVSTLYAEARRTRDASRPFLVGVCRSQEEILAYGTLGGVQQFRSFSSGMRRLGYECLILDAPERMHHCDVLFLTERITA